MITIKSDITDIDSILADPAVLGVLKTEFINSEAYKEMLLGEAYYTGRHKIYKDAKDKQVMVAPYHNELVDQLADYLTVDININEALTDTQLGQLERIKRSSSFGDVLRRVVIDTQNTGNGAIALSINDEGLPSINRVDPKTAIPICYDNTGKLQLGVVFWEDAKAIYYNVYSPGKIYQFKQTLDTNGVIVALDEGTAMLSNTEDFKDVGLKLFTFDDFGSTALMKIRTTIDAYDKLNNDEYDDINSVIERILVLAGYPAQDVTEFKKAILEDKIVKVDESGSLTSMVHELPTVARQQILARLEDNIYRFGKGFKPEQLTQVSADVATLGYARLDSKAKGLVSSMEPNLDSIVYFISQAIGAKDTQIGYIVTTNKLVNNKQVHDQVMDLVSTGLLSDDTAIHIEAKLLGFDATEEIAKLEEIKNEEEPAQLPLAPEPTGDEVDEEADELDELGEVDA